MSSIKINTNKDTKKITEKNIRNHSSDDSSNTRAQELIATGWIRQSINNEPRLSELVELYRSLDFEVHLEPIAPELLESLDVECSACFIGHWDEFKMIFTRKQNTKE